MRNFAIALSLMLIMLSAKLAAAADIAVGSDCTLAQAISAANADEAVGECPAGEGADTISLSADVALASPLPGITSEIVIMGNGNTISGEGKFRIFHVELDGILTIDDLTLANGSALGRGGAIYNLGKLKIADSTFRASVARRFGGAIANWGEATISDSSFRENRSRYGGAIYNRIEAKLEMEGVAFLANQAAVITADGANPSAHIDVFGGALYNEGSAIISDSSFSDNRSARVGGAIATVKDLTSKENTFIGNAAANDAGAIYSSHSLIIDETTFIDNSAQGSYGGAILNRGAASITSSDFINNTLQGLGGAIANWGKISLDDSDFTGNITGRQGGAIYSLGELEISDSKFRDNVSPMGGAILNQDGGAAVIHDSDFTGNSSDDRGGAIASLGETSLVISESKFRDNVAENGGGAVINFGSAIISESSFRDNSSSGYGGALANGGSAVISESSFRDNIADDEGGGGINHFGWALEWEANNKFDNNDGGDCVNCDEDRPRGQLSSPRPTDTAAARPGAASEEDGTTATPAEPAGQAIASGPADIVVGGGCTLFDAIRSANGDRAFGDCKAGDGADIIALTADVKLVDRMPVINSDISIQGNGFTIDGDARRRIMYVSNRGSLSIENATLANGSSNSAGGAIYNNGWLNVDRVTFIGNRATDGGAIYNRSIATITNSAFNDNVAIDSGGAIYWMVGNLTMSGNTFSGNRPDNCHGC